MCAWATPGPFTAADNFPCHEDGGNCDASKTGGGKARRPFRKSA